MNAGYDPGSVKLFHIHQNGSASGGAQLMTEIQPVAVLARPLDEFKAQFFLQILNIDVDRGIKKIDLRAPDISKQALLRYVLSGILRKKEQQLKFRFA